MQSHHELNFYKINRLTLSFSNCPGPSESDKKATSYLYIIVFMIYIVVRVKGLEPPRLSAPEPKSGASTNSATPAHEH